VAVILKSPPLLFLLSSVLTELWFSIYLIAPVGADTLN